MCVLYLRSDVQLANALYPAANDVLKQALVLVADAGVATASVPPGKNVPVVEVFPRTVVLLADTSAP